jgi:hypothetical protein
LNLPCGAHLSATGFNHPVPPSLSHERASGHCGHFHRPPPSVRPCRHHCRHVMPSDRLLPPTPPPLSIRASTSGAKHHRALLPFASSFSLDPAALTHHNPSLSTPHYVLSTPALKFIVGNTRFGAAAAKSPSSVSSIHDCPFRHPRE